MNSDIEEILKLRRWVTIGHHIPGRIRLKYKLGILALLTKFNTSEIEATLQQFPALKNYKLNKATGSLVIEYDCHQLPPNLIEAVLSGSEPEAKQACYELSQKLNINGIS